jgi:hypothetical protein
MGLYGPSILRKQIMGSSGEERLMEVRRVKWKESSKEERGTESYLEGF